MKRLIKIKKRKKKRTRYSVVAARKVDFLVVGAQKGGTTALDAYLRLNPEICMAKEKEVHFFEKDKYFTRKVDYSAYHSHFDPLPSQRLLGEATPVLMYYLQAPRRIWEYNPDIKLIMVLRNPIDRAYSHWNMQRDRGRDSRSFWEAIHTEDDKTRETLPAQNIKYSYIARGFYSEQIRRLRSYFPASQMLALKSESLREEPTECMDQIWSFLGVDNIGYVKSLKKHSRPYTSSMTNREREYLKHVFEYEIKQLERMLNWDCSAWLES